MIYDNTNIENFIDDFVRLCQYISVDNNNQYYFDQDLIDEELITDIPNIVVINKIHKLCEMINNDESVLDRDLETDLWFIL